MGSGTVLDVADLTLRALSDDTSNADASASAGTLLAGDSGAQANSSVTPAVSATTGFGVQVNAANDVTIETVCLLTSVASAPGISVSGLVGVAQNAASATGSPTLTAQTGGHNSFHAGNILIESDYQDSSFDSGHANLGTSATATTTGGGGLVGTVGSVATVAHDVTATSSVGPGSSLDATGNITIENTSPALAGSGSAILEAQASASGDSVGGLASAGTTNATVSLVDQYITAVDSDPADPTTIAGLIVTIQNLTNTHAFSNVDSSNLAGLGAGGSISSTILDTESSLVHLEEDSTVQGLSVSFQNSPFLDLTPEITGNAGSALASVELVSAVANLNANNQIDLDPNVTVIAQYGVSMHAIGRTLIEAASAANSSAAIAFATATSDLVANQTDGINIGPNDLIQGDELVVLSAGGLNSLGSEAATYIAGVGGAATSNANGAVNTTTTITVAPGAQINSSDAIIFAEPTVDVGLEAVAVANTLQAYFANFVNTIDFFGYHTNLDNGEHPNTNSSRTDDTVVYILGQVNLIDYGTVGLTISPLGAVTGTFTDADGLTGPVEPLTLTTDSSGNYHVSGLTNTIVKTSGHTNGGNSIPVFGNPYQLSVTSGTASNDLTFSAPSTIVDQGPITEVPDYAAVTINSQLSTPLYLDGFNSTVSTPNDTLPTITFLGNGTAPVPQVDGQSAANLTVNADSDVHVNGFIDTGQGHVVIDTTGNIFTGPAGSGIVGQSVALSAGSGSVGTAAAPLTVVLENNGALSGSAAGNAYFAIERPQSAAAFVTYGPFSDVPLIQNLSAGGNIGLTLEGGIYYDYATATYQTRSSAYELQDVKAHGMLAVNNTAGSLLVDHGVTSGSGSPTLTATGGVSDRTATPESGATGSLSSLGSLGLPGLSDGAVACGDFNNNGFLSVAIAGRDNQGNFVTELWINNGDGTFTQDTQTQFVGVDQPSLSWVDVMGNGLLDLLVTGRNSARVPVTLLYLNNGNGSFTLDTQANLPGVQNGSAAWGDLNHDGLPDLVLTGDSASGPITDVFINNGNGTFTPDTQASLPGLTNSSVALGDYNNDGYLDILFAGQTAQGSLITEIFQNNGNGTFTLDSQANLPGVDNGSVAWGDFNNDGYLDILLTGTNVSEDPDRRGLREQWWHGRVHEHQREPRRREWRHGGLG